MGARGFYYDDCRSPTRWAREYVASEVSITSTPSQYDSTIGKYFHRLTIGAAGNQFKWFFLVSQKFKSCDLRMLVRTDNAVAARSFFNVMWSSIPSSGAIGMGMIHYGNALRWLKWPFAYYNFAGGSAPMTANAWYNLRVIKDVHVWKAKMWAYGDREPAWATEFAARDMVEGPPVIQNGGATHQEQYIGFGSYTDLVAPINHDIADIRITPIRRCGP